MPSATNSRNGYKNKILASLPKAEISRLGPHLSPVDLPAGKTLDGSWTRDYICLFYQDRACLSGGGDGGR